jgi:hypothetical protein
VDLKAIRERAERHRLAEHDDAELLRKLADEDIPALLEHIEKLEGAALPILHDRDAALFRVCVLEDACRAAAETFGEASVGLDVLNHHVAADAMRIARDGMLRALST